LIDTFKEMDVILHGVGSYPPGTTIGPAKWPHHDLIVIAEGAVDFMINGKEFAGSEGDALLIPPDHEFRGVARTGGATIWVQHFQLYKDDWTAIPLEVRSTKPVLWSGVAHLEWPQALLRRISSLQDQRRKSLDNQRVVSLALQLLLEEFRLRKRSSIARPNPTLARIQRSIDWVRSHPLPPPSITTLASQAGWSVSHFRARFKTSQGRSIGNFLRALRLDAAERMLRETSSPIKEISAQVGYSDPVAFHRAFVQRFRVTPARHRQATPAVF
jgi:AraC-like DNA-binding protein